MVKYRLTYFNARARAELARYILAYGGVDYEDVRVNKEEWQKLKPTTQFGQMPILEVDGVPITQSSAIARYLAKQFGLTGKNDLEAAKVDMIADSITDSFNAMVKFMFESDETKKAELRKKYEEETLPALLTNLEKLLVSNKGGDGFLVGDGVTWADLFVALHIENWGKFTVPWDKAPKLKALCARVEALPKIAAWIKKRPVTGM